MGKRIIVKKRKPSPNRLRPQPIQRPVAQKVENIRGILKKGKPSPNPRRPEQIQEPVAQRVENHIPKNAAVPQNRHPLDVLKGFRKFDKIRAERDAAKRANQPNDNDIRQSIEEEV